MCKCVCESCFCVLFLFKVCRRLEGLSVQICDDGMRHSETRRENDHGLIVFVLCYFCVFSFTPSRSDSVIFIDDDWSDFCGMMTSFGLIILVRVGFSELLR